MVDRDPDDPMFLEWATPEDYRLFEDDMLMLGESWLVRGEDGKAHRLDPSTVKR